MDQKKIGNFLRELRKNRGFTQEQAAEKLGISSRTISRWETGAYMPDISMLVDIAELYDVDIREIIDGERKEENMRKLVYKCFTDSHFIKTVTTYKEAKEWKEANEKNSFKDEAVNIKREETEKERKTRLERIAKRMKKIRDKQAV